MLYQTHARIHLGNIRQNLEHLRGFVGSGTRLLLSIKANAYGHGAVAVATMAQHLGLADWFGVSTVPEGMELRKKGIRLPILKFSTTFPEEMPSALVAGLTLTVASRANIQAFQALARSRRTQGRVHLKVDTGMGRIGVAPDEAPEIALFIERECPNLVLDGVYTHLPVAELEARDPFTRTQLERFRQVNRAVCERLHSPPRLWHTVSSGGLLAHRDGWLSMVRTGSLAYGYYLADCPLRPMPLRPGLSLLTRIAFMKKVRKGTGIGYGLTWEAPADTWIATLPVGFGDGFSRLLSNRGRVLVAGRSCPVVGRVCMDQSMIDLGPDPQVEEGQEVVLIGTSGTEAITIHELAQTTQTVTLDVTCRISSRVKRIYEPYYAPGESPWVGAAERALP